MYNLRPGEQFPITWQDSIPNDDTVYPQAVIKNARTQETLKTINLTSQGGGLYADNYQVPGDSSGLGFYISIIITVYTDSDHTTKSNNLSIENRIYKVKEELQNFGGGGIDYEYLKRMIAALIDEKIGSLPKPEKQDIKEMPVILKAMQEMGLTMLKPKDLEKIAMAISKLGEDSDRKIIFLGELFQEFKSKITEYQKKTDERLLALNDGGSKHQKSMDNLYGFVEKAIKDLMEEVEKRIKTAFAGVETVVYGKGKTPFLDKAFVEREKEEPKKDFNQIARRLI